MEAFRQIIANLNKKIYQSLQELLHTNVNGASLCERLKVEVLSHFHFSQDSPNDRPEITP